MKLFRSLKIIIIAFLLLTFFGVILSFFFARIDFSLNWRTANRDSAHIAPSPTEFKDAVVQVYAARTYGWRGLLAVHTWLAAKKKGGQAYKVYQVIGWRSFYGLPTLSIEENIPDRNWFGQRPILLKDLRGKAAEKVLNKIDLIANRYQYSNHYVFWPGPNSNTFIAALAREIPELHLALPPIAIGKDYLGGNKFFARAPSSSGCQLSFYGVVGILLAKEEGLEINILGLVLGFDLKKLSIILPGIGYVGIGHLGAN